MTERPDERVKRRRTPSIAARIVPWLFAAAFAGVLLALGIHRNSWEYLAIIGGLVAVGFLFTKGWRR